MHLEILLYSVRTRTKVQQTLRRTLSTLFVLIRVVLNQTETYVFFLQVVSLYIYVGHLKNHIGVCVLFVYIQSNCLPFSSALKPISRIFSYLRRWRRNLHLLTQSFHLPAVCCEES